VRPGYTEMQDEWDDWGMARKVESRSRMKWLLNMFKPFMSTGPDKIIPAFSQHMREHMTSPLCCICRACLAFQQPGDRLK